MLSGMNFRIILVRNDILTEVLKERRMKWIMATAALLIVSAPSLAQSNKPNYELIMECSYMVGFRSSEMILSTGGRSVSTRGAYLKTLSDKGSAIVRSKVPSNKWIEYILKSTKAWDALSQNGKQERIDFCTPYLERQIK